MHMISASAAQDYARPRTLVEAGQLMAAGGWKVLAGGTDLYPAAGARLSGAVLDLSEVQGVSGIAKGRGLRIGATTTWTEIAEADLPAALRALQQAARQIGGRQVQNVGTIGGNLCNASPAADGVPPLLALSTEVELVSESGQRRLALNDFLQGPRRTALRPGEILTAVHVPEESLRGRSAFLKLGARSHLVISIAMVAARIVVAADRITEACVSVGACSPVAVRLPAVEAALIGSSVKTAPDRIRQVDVVEFLSPIDDLRASADYRLLAVSELVRRAVSEAAG